LDARRPALGNGGTGVHSRLPDVNGRGSKGVHSKQLPQLSGAGDGTGGGGRGIHANKLRGESKRPVLAGRNRNNDHGNGVHAVIGRQGMSALLNYFAALAERLRRVRVCCGDWRRVLKPSVTIGHGCTAVFLDPPYGVADRDKVYNHDSMSIAKDVRAWCAANGADTKLRIALCGYDGEHNELEVLGWDKVTWKAGGGYGNQGTGDDNAKRERIWFSPHCVGQGLFS
jgi:hypothetical protein